MALAAIPPSSVNCLVLSLILCWCLGLALKPQYTLSSPDPLRIFGKYLSSTKHIIESVSKLGLRGLLDALELPRQPWNCQKARQAAPGNVLWQRDVAWVYWQQAQQQPPPVLIAALLLPHLVPTPLVQQIRAEAGREAHL